uniref:Putative ovule protein n=1 Tax=Solanum chacoense TaxID=4108 RepID=A0A0V0GYF8_SOLCH
MPRHTSEALTRWNREGNLSDHKERWKIVPVCIWWTIWRERNQRCFENKSIPFQSLKLNCLITFFFWCNYVLPKKVEDITQFLDSLGGI